jgi:glycosyltransferase involved in cell wall biosynthesis
VTARYAFVYTSGRRDRLEAHGLDGSFPTEMFYGAVELIRGGLAAELLEERDLEPRATGSLVRLLTRAPSRVAGVDLGRVARLAVGGARARINRFDAVVTTSNDVGLQLGALRAARLLPTRVVAIVMGLVPVGTPRTRTLVLRRLLERVTVLSISRGEQAWLKEALGPAVDVGYLPFGVDHRFWCAGPGANGAPYALSVGNDAQRDFDLLARAWRADLPTLRIVTRRRVPAAPNVQVIEGDWRDRVLSDEALRDLVRGAAFVVVPLRETVQPSGQSVTLQAMACGKPVILTDTRGLWDRDLMRSGENCLLVPPGSELELARAVRRLAEDRQLGAALGAAGRRTVEQHFSAEGMAAALRELLEPA